MTEEKKPLTPFDFITAAGQTKVNLFEVEENEKLYIPFMVNKGFSYFPDSILHANEMNSHADLPKNAQFLYYKETLRSAKRFSKWSKLDKNDDLDIIKKIYQCNNEVAKQYIRILTENQLENLRERMITP